MKSLEVEATFGSSQHDVGPRDGTAQSWAELFMRPPISPVEEMSAYESLWMGQGAWFANIAELFRRNPGAVPSELVPREEVQRTWDSLREELGDSIADFGIRVHGAGEYPEKLRDADHPVEVVYYQGDWSLSETPSVAIVGTRAPSEEGVANTRRIANAMVREGFTVVSGLAKGIDSAAHHEALSAGGRTIAVIGTPLFKSYPRENSDLQAIIAREHLLISQVPFLRYKAQHYKANSLFFPARNVTMSALTMATIIVEAGNTSGTLVQARAALNQKRKLFILESCFRNPSLTWPAKYAAMGAIRVQSVAQILEALKDETSTNNVTPD